MKILITTPAGNIGRRVLREVLAPAFSVREIARDPARLPGEIREQVEAVRGSTDDPAALRLALEGVESLFWCVPTESQTPVGCGTSAEYARSLVEMFAELARGITRAEPRTAEFSAATTLVAWTERELLPLVESLGSQSKNDPTSVCICQA